MIGAHPGLRRRVMALEICHCRSMLLLLIGLGQPDSFGELVGQFLAVAALETRSQLLESRGLFVLEPLDTIAVSGAERLERFGRRRQRAVLLLYLG